MYLYCKNASINEVIATLLALTLTFLVSCYKVGSRVVFVTAGAMLVFFGVLGKVGAVLALIPDPIVGGTLLLGLGMVASIGIAGKP